MRRWRVLRGGRRRKAGPDSRLRRHHRGLAQVASHLQLFSRPHLARDFSRSHASGPDLVTDNYALRRPVPRLSPPTPTCRSAGPNSVAKMMHPDRQARVEDEQEVSAQLPFGLHTRVAMFTQDYADRFEKIMALMELFTNFRKTKMSRSTLPTSVSTISTDLCAAPASQLTNVSAAVDHDYNIATGANGETSVKASAVLADFSRKRLAQSLNVPTLDEHVRAKLRERGEPITLFGEGRVERRDRLRELMTQQIEAGDEDVDMEDATPEAGEDEEVEEEYYTTGPEELRKARQDIARYSLSRAKHRLEYQMEESTISLKTHVRHRKAIKDYLTGFTLQGSETVSDRAVGICRFAPNGQMIATGSWGGTVKLTPVPIMDSEKSKVLRGHTGQVGGISWYPGATLPYSNVSSSSVNLASGAGDGKVHLWNLEQDTPHATLKGHGTRVCRVEFDPSGKYLASAGYDTTWRLWDVDTEKELLFQEGHGMEVYSVAWNSDGSLLASGGLDSYGLIWDLRTGRQAFPLGGHIQPIYALDWAADGYRLLTASGDGYVKCWDIRALRETASIGGHKGGVTDLRIFKSLDGPAPTPVDLSAMNGTSNGDIEHRSLIPRDEEGEPVPKKAGTFFVTTGFDKEIHIFSFDDWAICSKLTGHANNVMSCDVTGDGRYVASVGHDRAMKLWGRDGGSMKDL